MSTRLWRADVNRGVKYRVIKNSEVIKIGDWITNESTGMANADAATEKIEGYAVDIVTRDKVSLRSPGVDTSQYAGGTWAPATNQYTAASNNETVDGVLVQYIEAKEGDLFVATLDAAKGTTTGSNKAGYFASILPGDSSKLDESDTSASRASCQFEIVDPYLQGSDTEVIVRVIARGSDQYSVAT